MPDVQPLIVGESLAVGDEGDQVEELQRRLQYLGYYQGDVDGRYGERTAEAVREFQRQAGHSEDGTTQAETWETLDREVESAGYRHQAHAEQGYAGDTSTQQAERSAAVGQLSEDGRWRWDGTEWQAVENQDAGAAEQNAGVGQISEDGRWRWDGTEWQPVEGQADGTDAGTGRQQPQQGGQDAAVGADGEPTKAEPEINTEIDDPATEMAELPTEEDLVAGGDGAA